MPKAKTACGDCLQKMKTLPSNSVDSVVTDPPYGISFMGKNWDYEIPSVEIWQECLRVLKPGGHLLAFAGTRTQHRMAVNIEDAGFEIRDMIAWVYGSGFPKSMDVSKAIDKAAGAKREVIGTAKGAGMSSSVPDVGTFRDDAGVPKGPDLPITAPATEAAKQWQGFGTALKPAHEPITVARKPFTGTVAANVLQHGTGAINVDGCRVGTTVETWPASRSYGTKAKKFNSYAEQDADTQATGPAPQGRFPANLIHDGSDEVAELFPETTSGKMEPTHTRASRAVYGQHAKKGFVTMETYGDSGSAARFFYCAKANKKDRGTDNRHPTVKPTDLMKYLCRLVTPPNGTVLDPFMGSGSTGKACMLEGFNFIGIELYKEYYDVARNRIAEAKESL